MYEPPDDEAAELEPDADSVAPPTSSLSPSPSPTAVEAVEAPAELNTEELPCGGIISVDPAISWAPVERPSAAAS